MNEERIIVKNAKPERKYFKTYYDFLYNKILNGNEKLIFIILKSFLDFSMDRDGTNGTVFPTIQTICEITGWGNKKVIRIINSLVDKGVVERIHRGLNKPNLYILSDYAAIWAAENVKEVKEIVENDGKKPMTAEEHIAELKKLGYDVEIKKAETMPEKATSDTTTMPERAMSDATTMPEKAISDTTTMPEKAISDTTTMPEKATSDTTTMPIEEKEPISAQNKVTDIDITNKLKINDTTQAAKSQAQPSERYTLDQIHQHFDYETLIQNPHYTEEEIDSVMSILYTALNTTKPTIRINGEDKPSKVVISKLMKLNMMDIEYSIDKFKEQTERINNPTAYMLTILYNSKEQAKLDFTNMVEHDMYYGTLAQSSEVTAANAATDTEPAVAGQPSNPQGNYNQNRPKNQFDQFMQREVSQEELDELERKLLGN